MQQNEILTILFDLYNVFSYFVKTKIYVNWKMSESEECLILLVSVHFQKYDFTTGIAMVTLKEN